MASSGVRARNTWMKKKMKENPLGKQQVPLHEKVFEAKDTHTERTYTKEEGKKVKTKGRK